jgi:hypothetical protein
MTPPQPASPGTSAATTKSFNGLGDLRLILRQSF